MQLFILFLLFAFVGGIFFWSEKVPKKAVALIVIGLFLVIGYYFFYRV